MQNPNYIFLSRHNLYYFRFPLPRALHPFGKSTQIKLSLNTRCPQEALQIARGLIYFGQNALSSPAIKVMEFQEIRDVLQSHFLELRDQVKSRIAKHGQLTDQDILAYKTTNGLAASALIEKDYTLIGKDDELEKFIHLKSMAIQPDTENYGLFRTLYLKAYRDYCDSVLEYNSRFDKFDFSSSPSGLRHSEAKRKTASVKMADQIEAFIGEKLRLEECTEKTAESYKKQLHVMLSYLGEDCSVYISRETAIDVVRFLSIIPKNLNKIAEFKHLTHKQIQKLNIPKDKLFSRSNIAKYINTYIGFYDWAIKYGVADDNYFKPLKLKMSKDSVREMFTPEQLAILIDELKTGRRGICKLPHHKWGGLICIYTGARLNEIAQLELTDIKQVEGVWCFDLNDDEKKTLKNKSSKRLIPIHKHLLELGLLDYLEEVKQLGKQRLLYQLSFDKNNGFGRNLGRWFNDGLLKKTHIKRKALVLHCSRHSILTYLMNADVPESIAKAISGHKQSGAFYTNYFQGYNVSKIKAAIDKVYLDLPLPADLPT